MALTWIENKYGGLTELSAKRDGSLYAVVHHQTGLAWFVYFASPRLGRGRIKCRTRAMAVERVEREHKEAA